MATPKLGNGNRSVSAISQVLMLSACLWCALVIYVIVSVTYGVAYPLGRSLAAGFFYSMMLKDAVLPDRTKLDLPIALIHAFGLFKCSQRLWRGRTR